jgi:uncharacterized protein DUF4402
MRHAVVASIILLLTSALDATAQTTANADAAVRALVSPRPIFMTATGETNFGVVTGADIANVTGTAVINPKSPGAGQSTAVFSVSGEPNTLVVVTCRGSLILTLSSNSSHAMRFEPTVTHSTDLGSPGGAGQGCNGGGTFSSTLGGGGELYMWLGGSLSVHSHNPPTAGMYTGIYTHTISY